MQVTRIAGNNNFLTDSQHESGEGILVGRFEAEPIQAYIAAFADDTGIALPEELRNVGGIHRRAAIQGKLGIVDIVRRAAMHSLPGVRRLVEFIEITSASADKLRG